MPGTQERGVDGVVLAIGPGCDWCEKWEHARARGRWEVVSAS